MLIIKLTKGRKIPSSAITVSYTRSSGPGGQNVNKVATKARIKVNLLEVQKIVTDAEFKRIQEKLKNRIDQDGYLFLSCDETRHQKRNFEIGLKRIESKLRSAVRIPKRRKATKPTKASKERRLKAKKIQSDKKKLRQKI